MSLSLTIRLCIYLWIMWIGAVDKSVHIIIKLGRTL
ncbi:hypothetical protein PSET11_00034 [Arthrobacter ulcerisalmonis]|uniref:Uncharacterized protein n=1 Tax=Arthrobacter ulcerisalmonis TaxID=2483813 RepID=A0A3P5W3V3_9MICC|nr:hypothetical protein PSET11_00034 [Arthrobacter ulcerisalmonis]